MEPGPDYLVSAVTLRPYLQMYASSWHMHVAVHDVQNQSAIAGCLVQDETDTSQQAPMPAQPEPVAAQQVPPPAQPEPVEAQQAPPPAQNVSSTCDLFGELPHIVVHSLCTTLIMLTACMLKKTTVAAAHVTPLFVGFATLPDGLDALRAGAASSPVPPHLCGPLPTRHMPLAMPAQSGQSGFSCIGNGTTVGGLPELPYFPCR